MADHSTHPGGVAAKVMIAGVFAVVVALAPALPAQAIIHEIVASHCAAQENHNKNVDPPGQLREGNSFARALQASKVYDVQFGVDQGGVTGLNFETGEFGPLPGPDGGDALSVFVDNERPNAKLAEGDEFIWGYFQDGPLHVYVQLYDLDHPAFERCTQLQQG